MVPKYQIYEVLPAAQWDLILLLGRVCGICSFPWEGVKPLPYPAFGGVIASFPPRRWQGSVAICSVNRVQALQKEQIATGGTLIAFLSRNDTF